MTISQPLPRIARFERLAFGMFVHYGLYSQLGQGEWVQYHQGIDKSKYMKLMDKFTAEKFDGREIARLAKSAGMKYVTLTARHHEGFSLYDTRGLNEYDVMHSPARRDLVAEFVEGCRMEGIIPMLYHTTIDWYEDSFKHDFDAYLEYLRRSVELLCTRYGEIGGFWFDGNWAKPTADWKLDELYGMIRRYQPDAMIINNTSLQNRGALEHPEIDSVTFEHGRPSSMNRSDMPKYVSAEMCYTINDHWGFGEDDLSYKSTKELIETLLACRKVGANYLLNVGPDGGGEVPPIQQEILRVLGRWMDINGRAVYEGMPSPISSYGADFALEANGKSYLFIHDLHIVGNGHASGKNKMKWFAGITQQVESVRWLDNGEELNFEQDVDTGAFGLLATGYPYGRSYGVRVAEVTFCK
ncbi:alpha-L-fucosidase [Bacillus sp. 3255]|uniref:alpha-L-fucosidase n=1 Tax=Bacillus sp. 3255 TaxID=2817904 RepID=UPI002857F688|nr:alpha-L-fucosidase [Bacillus sp. 3255]MDR6882431.1 alpha-L-fucosidase [Bacillus sp. 3255]